MTAKFLSFDFILVKKHYLGKLPDKQSIINKHVQTLILLIKCPS